MSKVFFKVKTNYLKVDNESENGASVVSEVRLFEAVDYIDAQAHALAVIQEKGLCGEYDFDIQKSSYDSILYRGSDGFFMLKNVKEVKEELKLKEDVEGVYTEDEKETYWYEIKVTKQFETDKGETKYQTSKYLVEGTDLEDAIEVFRSFFKDEDEDYWWFTSIQETPIEEVILLD